MSLEIAAFLKWVAPRPAGYFTVGANILHHNSAGRLSAYDLFWPAVKGNFNYSAPLVYSPVSLTTF